MDQKKINQGEEMKRLIRVLPIAALLAGSIVPQPLWADTASLEARLDSLEAQVAQLKQELKEQKEQKKADSKQTQPTAYVTANSKDGFAIKSTDGNYSLKVGGYVQVLAREFGDNKTDLGYASSIIPRRVRLMIQGTVAHDFDYFIQPDFGYTNTYSSITATAPTAYAVGLQDAWLDWKYFPQATIKAGKFKTPFDLENLQDTRYTAFPEIGLTGNLSPQRDLGVQLSGSLFDDVVNYAGGLFDGAADKENNYGGFATAPGDTNEKAGTGRIFIKPFKETDIAPLKGLGIGYAVSYGKVKGTDIPSYVSPGQAPVFTYNSNVSAAGPQIRTSPQAYYYYKSLGILAEKVNSQEELEYTSGTHIIRDKPTNRAWEVTGTFALTGEDESYNSITPRHDFDLSSGHWGAFELAARYGELKMDSSIFSENFANLNTSISKENTWGVGINWYLNHNVKLVFDFEQTKYRRGAVNGASTEDRKTEDLFTSMFQLSL
jgi:phosphate-selective porin OprO/OprP